MSNPDLLAAAATARTHVNAAVDALLTPLRGSDGNCRRPDPNNPAEVAAWRAYRRSSRSPRTTPGTTAAGSWSTSSARRGRGAVQSAAVPWYNEDMATTETIAETRRQLRAIANSIDNDLANASILVERDCLGDGEDAEEARAAYADMARALARLQRAVDG